MSRQVSGDLHGYPPLALDYFSRVVHKYLDINLMQPVAARTIPPGGWVNLQKLRVIIAEE